MSKLRAFERALHAPAIAAETVLARLLSKTSRAPRFCGVYNSRKEALDAVPRGRLAGYDHAEIAQVSLPQMSRRHGADYPVMYWLSQLLKEPRPVVDVGGHMGTKYLAFRDVLDVSAVDWTVVDLPQIIGAAKDLQRDGALPAALRFQSDYDDLPEGAIVIASGLFQYFDGNFADFLAQFTNKPKHIVVNKVATTADTSFFSLEKIGNSRVPYHIRNIAEWKAVISTTGYEIADEWTIPELSHRIATHPRISPSVSRGMYLKLSN